MVGRKEALARGERVDSKERFCIFNEKITSIWKKSTKVKKGSVGVIYRVKPKEF